MSTYSIYFRKEIINCKYLDIPLTWSYAHNFHWVCFHFFSVQCYQFNFICVQHNKLGIIICINGTETPIFFIVCVRCFQGQP